MILDRMETTKLGEYKVIKWKIKEESSVTHDFFVKAHQQVELNPRKPNGRTLLVTNVPAFISKFNILAMFKAFGEIQEIYLHQNPTTTIPEAEDSLFPDRKQMIRGYRVAYVVFKEEKSIGEIVELKTGEIAPLISSRVKSGMAEWAKAYNSRIVSEETLEENIKEFMQNFEKREILRRAEERMKEGEADEEGWINVTRRGKGKRSGAIRTEKMEERLKAKKKRWEKKLVNFTPTQIKESRAKQLDDLKKKFEEDKQRVSLLRQQRKFKPF
jgi:ribosomal RNA-processing protein 7